MTGRRTAPAEGRPGRWPDTAHLRRPGPPSAPVPALRLADDAEEGVFGGEAAGGEASPWENWRRRAATADLPLPGTPVRRKRSNRGGIVCSVTNLIHAPASD